METRLVRKIVNVNGNRRKPVYYSCRTNSPELQRPLRIARYVPVTVLVVHESGVRVKSDGNIILKNPCFIITLARVNKRVPYVRTLIRSCVYYCVSEISQDIWVNI